MHGVPDRAVFMADDIVFVANDAILAMDDAMFVMNTMFQVVCPVLQMSRAMVRAVMGASMVIGCL